MSVDTTRKVRDKLLQLLRRELMGPGAEDETILGRPLDAYIVGRIAPAPFSGAEVATEDITQEFDAAVLDAVDDDEEKYEDTREETNDPPPTRRHDPSSFGLSFLVDKGQSTLRASVVWADYAKEGRSEGDKHQRWKRHSRETTLDGIAIDKWGALGPFPLASEALGVKVSGSQDSHVFLQGVVHEVQGLRAVSLFIVNRRELLGEASKSPELWMYQPQLRVSDSDNQAIFCAKSVNASRATKHAADGDRYSTELLYRLVHEFASGHGVAGQWRCEAGASRATEVYTEFLPDHEVPMMVAPADQQSGAVLDMRSLAETEDVALLMQGLDPIITSYENWITGIEEESQDSSIQGHRELKAAAQENIRNCRLCAERMRAGLELLRVEPLAREAFRFANNVMWDQRVHSKWAANNRQKDAVKSPPEFFDESKNRTWHPFQIAFILLNLVGVTRPDSEDRRRVDLLWFPTGGGKTEAYLGLSAYVLALRRLRGIPGDPSRGGGVGIIMRYTLRLLTVQQFQRAAALICACEVQRRKNPEKWGLEPFRIGIWVGRDTTPNKFKHSKEALSAGKTSRRWQGASPILLVSCPRCGAALVHDEKGKKGIHLNDTYTLDEKSRRTLIWCPNAMCPFHPLKSEQQGIPAVVVDEEIYRTCPSMVIATVDKFAQLPFEGKTRSLFGLRSKHSKTFGHLSDVDETAGEKKIVDGQAAGPFQPPELIIQDELHLISGPLGTMVGLYETVIDHATRLRVPGKNSAPAKIIASTATIRRAWQQTTQLYGRGRDLAVFPPSGIDVGRSFFSREISLEDKPGRLYVGVNAPGVSNKTLMVRVYSILLAAAGAEIAENSEAGDPYGTLVGYFSSLRTLGGAKRVVEDDVRNIRLKHVAERHHLKRRYIEPPRELTSRMNSADIPGLLKLLEVTFPRKEIYPVDVLLATNMISVGVDIDRLGLMVVSGQPKATAEYIQATSRVGRKHPGLVVMLYNWMGARDTSHYERFEAYHSGLYRYVEATHVTPYSSRALDRGLRGVFVSMMRLMGKDMSRESHARKYDATSPAAHEVIEAVYKRAEGLVGKEHARQVRSDLMAMSDEWSHFTEHPLMYKWDNGDKRARPQENSKVLLRAAGSQYPGYWQAPSSMREVEPTAAFYIDDQEKTS